MGSLSPRHPRNSWPRDIRNGQANDHAGSVLVEESEFEFNRGLGNSSGGALGVGLHVAAGASVELRGVTFRRNSPAENAVARGGAIYVAPGGGPCVVDDCRFEENSASYFSQLGRGGAVFAAGNFTATDSVFQQNPPSGFELWGGAAHGGAYVDCEFLGNTAAEGGGLYRGTAIGCVFEDNRALSDSFSPGGAASEANLIGCRLSHNHAGGPGGGAFNSTLRRCVVEFNTSRAVNDGDSGGRGGGLYECDAESCLIRHNTAVHKILPAGSDSDLSQGGGAWGGNLSYCILTGNAADLGAGYYFQSGSLGGQLTNVTAVGNYGRVRAAGVRGGEPYEWSCLGQLRTGCTAGRRGSIPLQQRRTTWSCGSDGSGESLGAAAPGGSLR